MKNRRPSEVAIKAAKEYTQATLEVITITPIVIAIQDKVLAQFNVTLEDGTPVTDIKRLYLVDDETANKIYEALHTEYISAGYELKEAGYCPLLIAEDKQRKAARAMNEAMEAYIPNGKGFTEKALCKSLNLYNQLTDLNYSYLKQF
jgi:hypothetical protein